MAGPKAIVIEGAKENNLKGINVKIPKEKLVIITGVSGSGKSSLAFDTIYAEGHRRYMENLSGNARSFLRSVKRPKVKKIENLPPAIAISQKSFMRNPRPTVGTFSSIYDLLRALYAHFGQAYCSRCGCQMEQKPLKEFLKKKI